MSSRKRRPNWTDPESLILAQLIQERKDIIRGKCSTGVSIHDKRKAWEDIAQAVNTTFPEIQRTVSDCNKKWENLLAKAREEMRRQKMKAGKSLSLHQFSSVTQIVISVMNLTDVLLQDREDVSTSESVETQQNSCGKEGADRTTNQGVTNNSPLSETELVTYPDPSTSPHDQNITAFTNASTSLAVQFSIPHAAVFTVAREHSNTPRLTPPPLVHCAAVQERVDLEMSVLRRQEAVLKLQEEYYTLKIKLMKKQMEASDLSDLKD